VIALVLSAPLFVAFAPSRGWALLRLAAVAGIVAITVGPILNVYTVANQGGSVTAALDDAVSGLGIAVVVALILGVLLTSLEKRRPELPGATAVRRIRGPALVLGVVAIALLAVVYSGALSNEVSQRWAAFKSGHVESSDSTSHLTTVSDPERYDYWRVALDVTRESPVTGIGAGNYQDAYTIRRHGEKQSRYAHDIWLRVLSETGVIGFVLLVGSLLAVIVAVARKRHALSPSARLLIAGAVSASVLVFIHASVDWIEEFPAILGPALALLFMAGRIAAPPPSGPPPRQAAGLVTGLVIAGIALASLVPAYLSLRFTERAEAEWVTDASAAYTDLDRAVYLNPLTSQPDLTRGGIAIARGEDSRAKSAFERAIDKEDNWYPHFELSTLASKQGLRKEALTQMKRALRLDSADTLVQENLARLRRGKRVGPLAAQAQIRSETAERFFRLRHPESH
jgi:tetratricopeptide (TPR) repeat protein